MELICVDREMCRRDGICIEACPLGSIKADADGYPVPVDEAVCIACGQCVAICPHGALQNNLVPMADFLPAPRERATFAATAGLMKARRSVRAFKDTAVPRETLAELLDIARFAPTAKNTQQISYIVTADPARTRTLSGNIAKWMLPMPGMERYARLHENGHDFVMRGAPHVIIALADADSDWGLTDAAIALSYLELAAAAHGLGVCWAGIVHRALAGNPELAASIGVPQDKKVCGALMIGQPKYRYALVPPRNPAPVSWL
ncbi:MAG: nitroreductase family protein [Humidesulfovibrio sp.]|nr:nitroreductase family protein [Humidesulfovibrio sp.]